MVGLILCWAVFAVSVAWLYLNLRRAADRFPRRDRTAGDDSREAERWRGPEEVRRLAVTRGRGLQ